MSLNAVELSKLSNYASSHDEATVKNLLRRAGNGDTGAVQTLVRDTGLAKARVLLAAEDYLAGKLDEIFAAGSPEHAHVTGRNVPRTGVSLPPPESAAATRNGGEPTRQQLAALGAELKPLLARKLEAERQLPVLTRAAHAKAAERDAHKTVYFFGKKHDLYERLQNEAAVAEQAMAAKHAEIANLAGQMNAATDRLLRKVGDVDFTRLGKPLASSTALRESVDSAVHVVRAAVDAVRSERSSENWQQFWGGKSFFIPGTDDDEGGDAYTRCQQAVKRVNSAVNAYNAAVPDAPQSRVSELPPMDSGQRIDNVLDIAGSVLRAVTESSSNQNVRNAGAAADELASRGGSVWVSSQLAKMQNELGGRLTALEGMQRDVSRQANEITTEVQSLRSTLSERALAEVP